MILSKNVSDKKCAPKLLFFNEDKVEKVSDNFWHRKLTYKVKFWSNCGTFDTSPLTQVSKFNNFLWVCWFLGKNFLILYPWTWNSITSIAITLGTRAMANLYPSQQYHGNLVNHLVDQSVYMQVLGLLLGMQTCHALIQACLQFVKLFHKL